MKKTNQKKKQLKKLYFNTDENLYIADSALPVSYTTGAYRYFIFNIFFGNLSNNF